MPCAITLRRATSLRACAHNALHGEHSGKRGGVTSDKIQRGVRSAALARERGRVNGEGGEGCKAAAEAGAEQQCDARRRSRGADARQQSGASYVDSQHAPVRVGARGREGVPRKSTQGRAERHGDARRRERERRDLASGVHQRFVVDGGGGVC